MHLYKSGKLDNLGSIWLQLFFFINSRWCLNHSIIVYSDEFVFLSSLHCWNRGNRSLNPLLLKATTSFIILWRFAFFQYWDHIWVQQTDSVYEIWINKTNGIIWKIVSLHFVNNIRKIILKQTHLEPFELAYESHLLLSESKFVKSIFFPSTFYFYFKQEFV